jgi:hypothetical protein
MLECVELYLKEGLVEYKPINLERRKLLDNTAPEFIEFAEQSIQEGPEYEKTGLYNDFKFEYTDFGWLKQRTLVDVLFLSPANTTKKRGVGKNKIYFYYLSSTIFLVSNVKRVLWDT